MERDRFWQLVEQARSASGDAGDLDEVADALTDVLCRLDEEDVVAFGRTLNTLTAELGDPPRTLAGRLVAQGRARFEAVTGDPDRFAEFFSAEGDEDGDEDGGSDGEALFEAPYDAYGRIVGDDEGYAEAVSA